MFGISFAHRWSFFVPLLFYMCFMISIWTLTLPLRSNSVTMTNSKLMKYLLKNDVAAADNVDKPPNSNGNYLVNHDLNEDPNKILGDIFVKADTDGNGKLNVNELSKWINKKIMEHLKSAVQDNFGLFRLIDVSPRNGLISWNEYHKYFLKRQGLGEAYIGKHDEKRHRGLHRTIKEQIMRDKASWAEAARSDPNSLTMDEFLAFMHPESNAAKLLNLVDELLDKFDQDGDEFLTEEEFAILKTDGADDNTISIHQEELVRREEFRRNIDTDGDGNADRRELLRYVAPQSPRHGEQEAETLISLADVDHDQMLSLSEILARPELFLRSKMVNTAGSFHDEF